MVRDIKERKGEKVDKTEDEYFHRVNETRHQTIKPDHLKPFESEIIAESEFTQNNKVYPYLLDTPYQDDEEEKKMIS